MRTAWRGFGAGALALAICAAAAQAAASDFRLELGAGVGHSDYNLRLRQSTDVGDVAASSRSALGTRSGVYSVAGWVDGWPWRDFSFGLEYLRTRSDADVDLGFTAAGQLFLAATDFTLDTDTVMLNVVWRRNAQGPFRPYLGAGVGASWLEGRIRTDVVAGPLGPFALRLVDEDALVPSAQLFLGLDYDVAGPIYIGAATRYFWIDGRLFGVDQVLRELAVQAKIGVRF